jgi:hypothetical protein
MVSPTPRSTVRGAGVTRLPVTVTATVRCAGLPDGVDDEEVDDPDVAAGGAVAEEPAPLEEAPEVAAPPPPQAASPATRTTHPAYRRGVGHVILVTIRSLDRPF